MHIIQIILQTRDTGAQCHKGNSIDRILQVDETTQVTGNIANNSSTGTNHGYGDDEAGVAIANPCFVVKWENEIDQLHSFTDNVGGP